MKIKAEMGVMKPPTSLPLGKPGTTKSWKRQGKVLLDLRLLPPELRENTCPSVEATEFGVIGYNSPGKLREPLSACLSPGGVLSLRLMVQKWLSERR